MTGTSIEIGLSDGVGALDPRAWDRCAAPETADGGRPDDPFTTHRFLAALEESGSVGPGTGWQPRHLVAREAGEILAVSPLYLKSHSHGEYIFDFAFADAYERAGGRYYPKLQVAVPFTPVTGRRLLARSEHAQTGRAALLEGLAKIAGGNRLSSAHVTFCTEDEAEAGRAAGFLPRVTQQYHWINHRYRDFDDFLGALSSRKRKNTRKERATAQGFGGRIHRLTGEEIRAEHWDAMWRFYLDTGARKWGTPYLTRAFFEQAHATLRDDVLLILAERDGHWIAGALNFIGRDGLFGRYWGCLEDHPCLHFEVCYHQAVEFAIEQGLGRVEAGAQGEHKLARGYLPRPVHSLHWFADAGFRTAVERYLEAERSATGEEIEVLTAHGPFRRSGKEEE